MVSYSSLPTSPASSHHQTSKSTYFTQTRRLICSATFWCDSLHVQYVYECCECEGSVILIVGAHIGPDEHFCIFALNLSYFFLWGLQVQIQHNLLTAQTWWNPPVHVEVSVIRIFCFIQVSFTQMSSKSKRRNFTPHSLKSCSMKTANENITNSAESVAVLEDLKKC